MNLKPNWFQRFLYLRYKKLHRILFGIPLGVILRGYPDYIHIGDNVRIASNVQIITRNHDLEDISKYDDRKDVYINDNCWIGANAIILPDVKLGEHTVVGAGSVVTKSFPEGFCVIAGNPAKKIKNIEIEKSNEDSSEYCKYCGNTTKNKKIEIKKSNKYSSKYCKYCGNILIKGFNHNPYIEFYYCPDCDGNLEI